METGSIRKLTEHISSPVRQKSGDDFSSPLSSSSSDYRENSDTVFLTPLSAPMVFERGIVKWTCVFLHLTQNPATLELQRLVVIHRREDRPPGQWGLDSQGFNGVLVTYRHSDAALTHFSGVSL